MSIIKNTPKHEVKNADLDLLREMKIADEMYAEAMNSGHWIFTRQRQKIFK